MTEEALQTWIEKEFPSDMKLEEVACKLDTMESHPDIEELRVWFENFLLDCITIDFISYSDMKSFQKGNVTQLFLRNTEKLPKERNYFWSVYYFFIGEYEKSLFAVQKSMQKDYINHTCDLQELVYFYLVPFKNAFPGFWDRILEQLEQFGTEKVVLEHCELIRSYYACSNEEEKLSLLTAFLQTHPDSVIAKELLGTVYGNLKMWKNQIACFESVIEQPLLYSKATWYFSAGWAYGMCKDWKQEEVYYRMCLELEWDYPFANNNLAYGLYQQKRYAEAKEILEKCLQKKLDLSFVPNNYVRVLLAMGDSRQALSFIKKGTFPISKALIKRAEKAQNDQPIVLPAESAVKTNSDLQSKALEKAEQFSSERLLEEELTARIESGMPVFGKQLKIYQRKGEYGRQYIIPIGRLDLLCEDAEGNLYIIELKKDSGYDDAYAQTAAYLDWFEKSAAFANRNIYGIICVNHPSQKLLKKVHADARMQIYEYQISYTER